MKVYPSEPFHVYSIVVMPRHSSNLRILGTWEYRIRVFFMPLNFHEFHKLFWIREIKFVKCYRNVIAILVAILKFLVKTHGFVKIQMWAFNF